MSPRSRLLALLAALALPAFSWAANETRGVPELPRAAAAAPLETPALAPAAALEAGIPAQDVQLSLPGIIKPSAAVPAPRPAVVGEGTASRPVPASLAAAPARAIPEARVYSSVYTAPAAAASYPASMGAVEDVKPVDESKQAAEMAERLNKTRAALANLNAVSSLAQVTLEPKPGYRYMPSPRDWRDEIIYSVLVDRFARGADAKPEGDPANGKTRHGGDLKGALARLDYVKGLGATTLLLSPVTMTTAEPEAYHGYGPIHFMAVDPHLGTLDDFKKLVDEAHKRGLRVVFDLVLNHSGPVFKYKDGDWHWRGMDKPAKETEWTIPLHPTELAQDEHFTRHGVIENWSDDVQARNGDFPPDYRHFRSEDSDTQALLIKTAAWWIKETDIDGLRIDALRHINPAFARRFSSEIGAYAKSLGKDNFLLLGEHSTGIDAELGETLKTGVQSLYNYPEYRRVNYALHSAGPTRELEDSLTQALGSLGDAVGRLVRFIDNHDVYRFLRDGEPLSTLKLGLAFVLFSLGIPYLYYGTEQAFRQKTGRLDPEIPQDHPEPENRQDMFAEGQFKTASSAGDKFDARSESYAYLSKLAQIRSAHPALRRGEQYVRWSDPNGPGIYAFSRIHESEEVVVVMNTADEPRRATMYVDANLSGPGTSFSDELDPSFSARAFRTAGGGSQISVEVPPRGVRVLSRRKA